MATLFRRSLKSVMPAPYPSQAESAESKVPDEPWCASHPLPVGAAAGSAAEGTDVDPALPRIVVKFNAAATDQRPSRGMVWPLAQRVVCQKIPTLVLSELVAVVGVIASRPWSGALECGERQGRQVVGGADRGTSGSVSVHRPGLDGAGRVVPWLPRRRMVNADG